MTTVKTNSQRVERFITAFHNPAGNKIWPNLDPDSEVGRYLAPFLQVLREDTEVPAVLFRTNPDRPQKLYAYVIPLNRSHASAVAEQLTAFVGPSWSTFDGRSARLDPHDPIDDAVLEFAGDTAVFVLAIPRTHQRVAVHMLRRMQATARTRPFRTWHAPRPVGRLLAEFDVALAAGDNNASDELLRQIRSTGGLSAANLAHLRIKQLSRLGQSSALLRLPELDDVIAAEPPTPVRDAILTAMYDSGIAQPLAAGQLTKGAEVLAGVGHRLLLLLDTSVTRLSAEALVVLSLAAWTRDQTSLLNDIQSEPGALDKVAVLAPDLAAKIKSWTSSSRTAPEPVVTQPVAGPETWSALARALATGDDIGKRVLREHTWQDWPPPSDEDIELAMVVEEATAEDGDQLWGMVGAFLDATGYEYPAHHTARALVTNAVLHERYRPGDLSGLVALVGMVLRSAPDKAVYSGLLKEVGEQVELWASIDRATVILDLVDLLARHAAPDTGARQQLGYNLLEPLRRGCRLLEQDQVDLAKLLAAEIDVLLDWPQTPTAPESQDQLADLEGNLLLYSLNEDALAHTRQLLLEKAPRLKVSTSSDHVGKPQLKQLARNADVIVLATRAAKHAATTFIQDNAGSAVVGYADGSGVGSLYRKAVELLLKHMM